MVVYACPSARTLGETLVKKHVVHRTPSVALCVRDEFSEEALPYVGIGCRFCCLCLAWHVVVQAGASRDEPNPPSDRLCTISRCWNLLFMTFRIVGAWWVEDFSPEAHVRKAGPPFYQQALARPHARGEAAT